MFLLIYNLLLYDEISSSFMLHVVLGKYLRKQKNDKKNYFLRFAIIPIKTQTRDPTKHSII